MEQIELLAGLPVYTGKTVNTRAEQTIIGNMLMPYPERVAIMRAILEPQDFTEPLHQAMFQWIGDYLDKFGVVSFEAFQSHFMGHEHMVTLGQEYLFGLCAIGASECFSEDEAKAYALTVKECALWSEYSDIIDGINENTGKGALETLGEAAQRVMNKLESLSQSLNGNPQHQISFQERLEAAQEARRTGTYPFGVSCGLKDIDDALGGLPSGELTLLAGRPSMGKSALGVVMGMNAAVKGQGVLVVSLEMPADDIYMRLGSALLNRKNKRFEYAPIRQGRCDNYAIEQMTKAKEYLSTLPLIISQDPSMTIGKIHNEIRRAQIAFKKQGKELKLVIVDHIGLVRDSGRQRNKSDQVGEVSAGLKGIAMIEGISVLGLCQLNRGVEGREDKRPDMHDLRASGDLEQDAAVVMFIYRKSYYLERQKPEGGNYDEMVMWEADMTSFRNRADVFIRKNRNGPLCDVGLFCDMAVNDFRNLDIVGGGALN